MGEPCYSIVRKPKGFESANEMDLKKRIEGSNPDKCRAALEELLQNMLDGERFPTNLLMPVINRYQTTRFGDGQHGYEDKRIKKLLYVLWECLPKRGPDGRLLDRMIMVCGAFDKDTKHPNQYVCGSVLRTLGKTREPEIVSELVHSIEKCLEWPHAYQRKNAVLAIARIYKNFPDLNPSAPKLVAEYLAKENDDECKRAALQALLAIAPDEAQSYLESCNISEIHCMNASIQLLFVELVQRIYKKNSKDSKSHLSILISLIKSSSSPSVRYQAATALMRFSRDPESIKLTAACFIDICAKDSDNNVKLIALDSLMKLRKIHGAERVLRNSVMDILFILQSATDLELHEKIVRLSLDLTSPLNVGGIIGALRQELRKMQDPSVLCSQQETFKYRRLLVDTVYKISEKFPHAMVEFEMLDTLFELLVCNSVGERTSSRLIMLFKIFVANNPQYQGDVIKRVQENFNLAKDSPSTHRGLLQLLGDFSDTKEQIEKSYTVIKNSLGELPILASELRKARQTNDEFTGDQVTGDKEANSSTANGNVDALTKKMSSLVTADGSYATQSAINFQNATTLAEVHPPLRSYFLRNKFDSASVLCYALLKMACRYQKVATKPQSDKMVARFMLIVGSILNLGYSTLVDPEGNALFISNYQSEILRIGMDILQLLSTGSVDSVEKPLKEIEAKDNRSQLSTAFKDSEQEGFTSDSIKESQAKARFDDSVSISLFSNRDDDLDYDLDSDDQDEKKMAMPDMFSEIPLTGTIDPIYAYCEFDVSQYDISVKIHLENRTKSKTFENVTIELSDRADICSRLIDRPEPIVLGPRSTACVVTNVKVMSSENKHLFGSIAFDDVSSEDKEQIIMLNDINVNITDYIKPASISFDDFRDVWRDCEWENKVIVKTTMTNLKEYLTYIVMATNMRCVTNECGLDGECHYLAANLYARSSFGKEALINVSIEKETPMSVITGTVKIRSRSQGMALSLGEKITAAQRAMMNSGDH